MAALGSALRFASSSAFGQASVLSKAVRTSESMEPALAFPTRMPRRAKKLARLRGPNRQAAEHRLAGGRRHGLRRPGRLRRRRGGRRGDAEHRPAGARGPEAHLDLFAADLHADALGHPDRPAAGAHRPDAADPRRRQDHQEPVGRRDLAAEAAQRRRLHDRALRQVARRRSRRHAPARHRLRRVLRLLPGAEGAVAGVRQAPLSRPRPQSRAARDAARRPARARR